MWPFPKIVEIPDKVTFPKIPPLLPEDAEKREEILTGLRTYVEALATHYYTWYMEKRKPRQVISLWIRAISLCFIFLGGLWPLIPVDIPDNPHFLSWGYVLIGIGGGLLLFDKYFGLSSAWMRYIVAAEDINTVIDGFRMRWLQGQMGVKEPGTDNAPDRFQVLITLVDQTVQKLHSIVVQETNAWRLEFQSNVISQINLGKSQADHASTQAPNPEK
jgi:hypothetical protein